MWFDSHCHLHLCEQDAAVSKIVGEARSAEVEDLVAIGIDLDSSRRSQEIARECSVYFSAGVHPNSAGEWDQEVHEAVRGLAADDERCVAVGETGLDFYRDAAAPDVQLGAFLGHIEIARETGKALVIHTRDSISAALDALGEAGAPKRLVFHCWSGSRDDLARALDLGAFISFAGNVSFRNAEELRTSARAVPSDRLVVETDSPFLTPVPFRGRPNRPALVTLVGEAVAEARGEPVESLARVTTRNARTLFGLA